MLKIVVGGHLNKPENEALLIKYGGDQVQVETRGDLDAAMGLKTGKYDYYFGSCQTGAGGALAMAIAMCGMEKCITVGMVGKILSEEDIRNAIHDGKTAFGFVCEAAETVIPVILKEILKGVQHD